MNKSILKKFLIIVIVLLLFVLFEYFDIKEYFRLEYLKETKNNFKELYEKSPVKVLAIYMLVYIISTAISLPGAVILTLAGGAMFGLVVGTIVVSFASSLGALLACFVSRYVLGDWVQNKFGNKLSMINQGIEKDGAFYLFTLRLIPVFPFWLINLLMGLTKFPLFKFYWVSQIGMLAATIIYVNAGSELSKIKSLSFSEFFSFNIIISLVVLAVFPFAVKKIFNFYKANIRKDRPMDGQGGGHEI